MREKGLRLLMCFPAIFIALAGCNGGERYVTEEQAEKVEAPLVPATHFQMVDIPVPAIIRYDRRNSTILETGRELTASLVYTGRVHSERLATFFREHMPERGWNMKKSQVVGNRYLLYFTKGNTADKCRITIDRGSLGTVKVTVDVN